MTGKKRLYLVLAVVLASGLFVTSLMWGGRGPGAGPQFDPQAPRMERIAGWFSRPVKAAYLALRSGSAADCRLDGSRITIRAGRTCVYAVAADRFLTRRLRLARLPTQERSGRLDITLEQTLPGQEKPMRVDHTLDPGQTTDALDIYGRKDTATLRIQARGLPFFDPDGYVIEIRE